ncbi:GNAT family N-acetyltransferase [Streptomyces sp. AF1B]|jgi:ribosomal protein S18 acetylase RimI-like enzyme|uniref:GNAT family N-acetyltransferase n=1 Tax=Streptomyces sp. AF1B TaxID=3399503 RepID=UPI003AAEE78C
MTAEYLPRGVVTRIARPEDYDVIVRVIDGWWGRPVTGLLNRLYLNHFCDTSLIAESEDGELVGFVIGFMSPSRSSEAYIHFTGVAPNMRRSGLARSLYEQFFAIARKEGRTTVKAVTSPHNSRSILFHTAMGFDCSEPMIGYDGPDQDRVVFSRSL